MSGSDWGRHSKSCCKTPLGNMAEYCLTNNARVCNFLYCDGFVNMWFITSIYYQVFELKWWENEVVTIHVQSRLTALLTWAASKPRLDVCCDLRQHLQGAVVFTLSYARTYIDFARPITHQIVFHTKCNQIQFSYHTDGIFCSILFYCIMFNI